MQRAVVLLVAVFLVNLPFVHQTWNDRRVDQSGRDVEARVLDTRAAGGSYLVEYRLPRSVDAARTRYSARVDRPTYEQARETSVLRVRVVPGKPAAHRPAGAVGNNLFAVVAGIGDLVLLLVGVAVYRRWRRRSLHVVRGVDDGDVTLESARGAVTVRGPGDWAERLQPGQRVSGRLHLVTDEEVVPGSVVGGFEQVHGASYVVRGRVVDVRPGQVVLELADGSRLPVETGGRRIRADLRDPTEVRGTLCFTPRG